MNKSNQSVNHPRATILLSDNRTITLDLYPEFAPITVNNFMNLAKEKYFDGIIFHRIIDDFMIQAGAYYLTDEGVQTKPKVNPIVGEFKSNGWNNPLKHELGVISMARTQDKNSASSQFFLCINNVSHLDGEYASFGKVVDDASKELILTLGQVPTQTFHYLRDFPVEPIIIKTILIEE